jgi:hypothetical protein
MSLVKRLHSQRYRIARVLYGFCYCPDDFLFPGSQLRRVVAGILWNERAYLKRWR